MAKEKMIIKRFFNKTLLISILLSSAISYFYYDKNTKINQSILEEKLFIAASGIKYLFDKNYTDRAIQKSVSEDEFNLLNEKMSRLARDMQVEYVYTLHHKDAKFFFIANSSTEADLVQSSENPFYKEYIPMNSSLLESITENKIQYAKTLDKWGSFESILIPFKLPNGEFLIYGADVKIEELEKGKFKERYISLGIFIVFTILFFSFLNSLSFIIQKRKFQYSSFNKVFHSIVVAISLAVSCIFAYLFYNANKELFFAKTDSKIFLTAIAVDLILPEDFHDRVEKMSKEEHQTYIDPLSKYANEVQIEYLYTMVEKDGNFFYSISSTNDKDLEKGTLTEFMEPMTQVEDQTKEAFYSGRIINKTEIGLRWGDFRNVFIPIKKEFGRHYALGADLPLENIQGFNNRNNIQSLIFFILIFFPVLSLVYQISMSLTYTNYRLRKNNFISLKVKITFFISTVTFLSLSIVSYIYFLNGKKIVQDKTIDICRTLAANLGNIAREDLLIDSTYEATNKALGDIGRNGIEGIKGVYIINAFGKFVADLSRTKKGMFAIDEEVFYIKSLEAMELKEEYSIKTRKQFLKVTYPIFIEYESKRIRIGAVIFEYDKDILYKPVYEVQKIIIYTGIILLILIIFITYFLSNYITKPLLYLTEGTKFIAKGNLDHILLVQSNDEVGLLTKRFNEMSSNLKKSYDFLEDKVTQRTLELTKTQGTLTTVLETAPIILFATDKEGIVTLCEGKALIHIGIQRGQAVGLSFFDLFEDKPEALLSAQSALNGTNVIVLETLERNTFEVNFNTLFDINHQIVGMVSTYFDITENVKSQKVISEERDKSDKLLLNILPHKIANELKANGFVKPILYDSVTVIFTDFKGFTKIASHMGPEELLSKLDMIFLQFDQICERRKIEKLKTIGDAYMCAGGLPEINTSHPIDACLAAIEMQHFMNETKSIMELVSGEKFWDMRLGIHTGEVIAGVIGKTKFAYDVWGDAVNTASRMESNGDIGKINISDTTYNSVKDFFDCEYRGKIEAKNKGMIDMYFLLRIKVEYSKDPEGIVPNDKFTENYKQYLKKT